MIRSTTKNTSRKRLIVVGDTAHFGRTISQILKSETPDEWEIRHTTYDGFRGMLNPRLLRETDLFVLDLWRSYPTGLRAEGIAVADQLSKLHAKSLIVSPLALGPENDGDGYWDVSSPTSLSRRCEQLLSTSYARKKSKIPESLRTSLSNYLDAPAGHIAECERWQQ